MNRKEKFTGVFPALYACYDDQGEVSSERVRSLTRHLVDKGVQGLYVGGSSGECIYQGVAERKQVLEAVMTEARGEIVVIAHVACNNTRDSQELAAHAESLGVDAIAAIPPIYFRLPDAGIAAYWNAISAAAPNTDFIIYNIPQLAGVALSVSLLKEMMKNPRVIGVKNSSMAVLDISQWLEAGGDDFVVFNGPDEQFLSGLAAGAQGGIGGTYGVMPELFLTIQRLFGEGRMLEAREVQAEVTRIILNMCAAKGNLYAVMKAILRLKGVEIGDVRAPLSSLVPQDQAIVEACAAQIEAATQKYC
ncbi:MAG: dihydrodipicolinate synthase family protein [Eubacteriales bacterium]|nr:dihydrodipicolinate synthase family protein [Eubacteriales bacterium]